MKLGLNLAVFGDRDFAAALDRAAELHLDAIELNAESGDPFTPAATLLLPGRAARVRREVESRGLLISALGNHAEAQLIGGPHHQDSDRIHTGSAEQKVAFGKAKLLDTARAAAELGVETVIAFVGCADWSRYFPWPDPEGWERMVPEFVETWSPILDEFGRLGVRLAHEPHPKQLAHNLETAEVLTEALGHRPEWGFNLDPANLALAGVDPCAFVQHLGARVYHVHAKDLELVPHNLARSGWQAHGPWSRPDRGVRFRIPGWGDLPWRRLVTELQLAGYRGVLSIEHEDPAISRDEGVEKATDFLRGIVLREPPEERWW